MFKWFTCIQESYHNEMRAYRAGIAQGRVFVEHGTPINWDGEMDALHRVVFLRGVERGATYAYESIRKTSNRKTKVDMV